MTITFGVWEIGHCTYRDAFTSDKLSGDVLLAVDSKNKRFKPVIPGVTPDGQVQPRSMRIMDLALGMAAPYLLLPSDLAVHGIRCHCSQTNMGFMVNGSRADTFI